MQTLLLPLPLLCCCYCYRHSSNILKARFCLLLFAHLLLSKVICSNVLNRLRWVRKNRCTRERERGSNALNSFGCILRKQLDANFYWSLPASFFFIFVFSIQLTVYVKYKLLPITGFELRISGPTEPQPLPLLMQVWTNVLYDRKFRLASAVFSHLNVWLLVSIRKIGHRC